MYNPWNIYGANPYQQAQMAQQQYNAAQQHLQNQQPQQPQPQAMPVVAYVCGIEGAKAFVVPMGGTYYLLDSESPRCWARAVHKAREANRLEST